MPAQAGHSPHTWLALACVAVCVLAAREKRTVAGCAGLLCFVLLCALLYLLTCEFLRLNLGKFGIGRYICDLDHNVCVCRIHVTVPQQRDFPESEPHGVSVVR